MKNLTLIAFVAFGALFAGCASVPMTSTSLDSDAKHFQPDPGKANFYINQKKGTFLGEGVILQIVLDGRIVGSLTRGTYDLLSVPPGEHVLVIGGQYENVAQVKVKVEQGKNYFFDASWGIGWAVNRVYLKQIGDEEGRKEVMASKRADALTY